MGRGGSSALIRRGFPVLLAMLLSIVSALFSSCEEEPPQSAVPHGSTGGIAVTEEQTQAPRPGEKETGVGWTPFL